LCQQRDCYASRLYWYTDLTQAKAAAQASGKPILSLRLLGRLDEDLSCANSRFFRVALYPNAQVSKVLSDRFILHWQSVRPVPKVTVDFGDGRKLERTLTGNSIHYILDASGQPIDAIPGLYGPQAFLRQLQQGEATAKTYAQTPARDRANYLRQYHRDRLNAIQTQWTADLTKLGLAAPQRTVGDRTAAPAADMAGTLAATKMVVENPMVSAVLNRSTLTQMTDQSAWTRLSKLYMADAALDARSIALIQAKQQIGSSTTNPVPAFEAMIALDTVRNEYLLHSQIHEWFGNSTETNKVDVLNTKVYADLFLTPSSDPWLGLLPTGSYSAIDNEGILKN
jgi:hypothetical protein